MSEFVHVRESFDPAALRSQLSPTVRRVQFDEPLSNADYGALASILEDHPHITLRAFGFSTELASLGFLSWFKRLRRFSVANLHHLGDLSGLGLLPDDLEHLDLGETKKALDLRAVGFRELRELRVVGHRRGLAELVGANGGLTALSLWRLPADEQVGEVGLPSLESLSLTLGSVKDLGWLRQFNELRHLAIRQVKGVSILDELARLPRLEWLWLDDLKAVESLPDFSESADLRRVDISDMRGLAGPAALRGLAAAPGLVEVTFAGCRLPATAFAELARHETLQRVALGLGNSAANDEASRLLGRPAAGSAAQFMIDQRFLL
ncbi:hypothetical protein [Catellatospora chokoriensis]|uniref:Leucine-rich repeat domain-containing protein n=1 Tax=Catellatospora chokoriensis TaxID=310353 RepID=A0A8J3NUU0_9ACTN|nr:hypothetical protein [Catellatospora chokoriensis]GIF93340.1 hypothetical protein Cch02nite_67840 [Catellatospora chokoriensis]